MNSLNKFTEEGSGIDVRGIFYEVIKYWYLFLLSLTIAFLVAKLYIRYSQPTYGVQTTILVKDDKKKMGAEGFIEGMELLSTSRNIQNEIEIIRSYENVKKTIEELNFEVAYFIQGNIKTGELYAAAPFTVKLDTNFSHKKNTPFYIKVLSDSTYTIYHESIEEVDLRKLNEEPANSVKECKFGEPCRSNHYSFIVNKSNLFDEMFNEKSEYYYIINDIDQLTHQYTSKLKIELTNKNSSILTLTMEGLVPRKEIDFLNKLSDVYIQGGLEEKNQITINTIRFIDAQLIGIVDSLRGVEAKLERFRSSEKVMNLSSAAEKAFAQLEDLEKEKAELLVKGRYYTYLLDYVNYNYDIKKLMAPSAIGIDDPLLNKLIEELHTLNSEKTTLGFSATDKNPTSSIIELKIENTKKSLIENLKNIIQASQIAVNDNQERMNRIQSLINKLPANERNLVNIQRKFSLNDNIYNYLMEKRLEAGIAKAANTADNKVINKAMLFGSNPIFPKTNKILSTAILFGLLIPAAFIFLKLYFSDTVGSKEIIERTTEVPVIGSIVHYKGESNLPIMDSPKSGVSESIRSLRVNLQYLAVGKKNKVIGITSSISGEGKTFFSSNLAASIALSGVKVILIGADLRKPKLHQIFGLDNSIGMSTYLINKAPGREIIRRTTIPNLDIITSGPVPPNPTELLESSMSEDLIKTLLLEYEYIIIDAPPVGIVADYYLLAKSIDANLYIVRQNYTKKELLKELQAIHSSKKLSNLFIAFNDVKNKVGYGYKYSYGYGYGYYQDDKTSDKKNLKGFFSRLFAKS